MENNSDCMRERELKWNGWGYRDSMFYVNDNADVAFTGKRYDISGKALPYLRPWMVENLGIDLKYRTPSKLSPILDSISSPLRNEEFLKELDRCGISYSDDKLLRLNRSHGHTVHDMIHLRNGTFSHVPDFVVWPKNHGDVVKIVDAANHFHVCIIPIGGGTSVSQALECPENESRPIISLDMTKMDRILWIDDKTQTARIEAGIIGQHLEKQLNDRGYTLGHEPDSVEFSSLGGWVATRASGMKKNKYGNIEDLIVHVTLVTPKGVLQKSCQGPRISSGPDLHHVILGSEGTLGVVTEVTLKIWPQPPCKKYGSILFPTFEYGVNCLREVAKQRCQPASIRLVDNEQFIFGQALKPPPPSYYRAISDKLKKLYVTAWKKFNPKQMCAATLVFEGTLDEVDEQERRINEIAKKFGGMPAGAENGRYGYMLTFAIAYLRDLGMEYSCLGESFETSVPWDRVQGLCENVKELLHRESKKHGIKYPIFASCRVTQVYDSGACVYFYFGFNYRGISDPLKVYDEIEIAARDEILACGGSISHHHGVGKLRKRWLPQTVGNVGLSVLQAIKQQLDPNNIFAAGNLFSVAKL